MTTSTHGFANNLANIMGDLAAMRSGRVSTTGQRIAKRVSFSEFLAMKGDGITPGHVYSECGLDPRFQTFDQFLEDQNGKLLLGEVARDAIERGLGHRASLANPIGSQAGANNFIIPQQYDTPINRGIVEGSYHRDLCRAEVAIPSPAHTIPYFDITNGAQMDQTSEGATIRKGTVTFAQKVVKITKRTRGVDISYEALRYNTVELMSIFMEQMGRLWGRDLNTEFVGALINGDNSDATESAAIIGVEDTGAKFQYTDYLRVWLRMNKMGHTPNVVLGSENMIRQLLNMDEFKNKQNPGPPILSMQFRTPLPTNVNMYMSDVLSDDQLIFLDSSSAMLQLTSAPLLVESDKIISKQMAEQVASITTGPAILLRYARCVVDQSLAYSGNGFPSWFDFLRAA